MKTCKIKESLRYTQSQVFKMDKPVEIAYACMLSRVPALFIGNPGTAKSHTCKIIASQFGERDQDWFYQSITAKTSPEKLLGGIIAEKMLQGIEEYNLQVGAASKIGNIFDELFKSQHPAMMNALLAYTDENPTVFSGGKNVSPEWHWLFATTNFEDLPESLSYDPLWDRMSAKVIIKNLSLEDSKSALKQSLKGKSAKVSPPAIAVEDLVKARASAQKINLDDKVIDFFYEKCLPILEKECYISQRKINSIFVGKDSHPSLLQSLAYLDGGIITSHTLTNIPYFVWQDVNSLDGLLSQIEAIAIPKILIAYNQMRESLEDFIKKCPEYGTFDIANERMNILIESIKACMTAFSEQEKKEVPLELRTKLKDLTFEAKKARDSLVEGMDTEF